MLKYWVVIFSVIFFSCDNNGREKLALTIPVEHINPTKDQQERRKQSEEYCMLHAIPVYKDSNALFVDPEDTVTIRTKDEVVNRALALCFVGLKSEGMEDKLLEKIDKDYGISSKLSPQESAYTTAGKPTEQQRVDANWRYESLHIMLWALGFVDTLGYPNKLCNVADDVKIIHDLTAQQFREKAKLRSKKEILDQADLILRLDWACVNARLKQDPMPGGLNSEIVQERHHSLNWLIKYLNQDWDDVSTNT
jgi:hypothetical protein